jgi:hypothetical protein
MPFAEEFSAGENANFMRKQSDILSLIGNRSRNRWAIPTKHDALPCVCCWHPPLLRWGAMTSRTPAAPLKVIVVADNPETVDGLLSYLDQSGIETFGSTTLTDLDRVVRSTAAVVLFPDGYSCDQVIAHIDDLRATHPRVLLLLVTREPNRFRAFCEPTKKARGALILPRPSFGWSILDSIRSLVTPTAS